MANLASVYSSQERWKEAGDLKEEVLETRKQSLGPKHPSTLISMNNLAHTWNALGKSKEALRLMSKTVKLCNKQLGPDHPDTVASTTALNKWSEHLYWSQQLRLQVSR